MAYFLHYGQSDRNVQLAQPITAPTSSFMLEYTAAITNSGQWQSVFFTNVGFNSNTAGSLGSQRDGSNNKVNVFFTLDGKSRVIYNSPVNFQLNTPFTIRIEWLASTGQIKIYQDGNLLTTYNNYWTFNIMPIVGIGQNSFQGDLYYFRVEKDGTVYNYNPSASNGTGSTLIDTVGGNNGTLVNFPADNSQWVFYDDGGTANQSTVNYDLGAIDYAVSSQITAPANTASVGYDLGAISYAISAQQIAPGNNASLSYDIGEISYAVSAQQSAPQFNASVGYDIGSIGFAVQANTGAAMRTITALYDIGSIGWQVDSEWLPDDATVVIGYDIGEITFNSSVLNIPEGGFPSDPSKQYPNNPGWRYSVFFR